MSDSGDSRNELEKWYEEYQKLPAENHLLCPRLDNEDDENYKDLSDSSSKISQADKRARIEAAQKRIEITYWNSLIFGFDKKDAGKWLDQFTNRLESCLKTCADCVLNWHMTRQHHLDKFSR